MENISFILSAAIQLLLFSAIPFIWWFITARKISTFHCWIGLKYPTITNRFKYTLLFIGTVAAFFILAFCVIPHLLSVSSMATSQFLGKGLKSILPAIIYSFVQTSLSEEILFRGFIGKRLSSKIGFAAGNGLQATLFGLLHGVMFFGIAGIGRAMIIVLLTGLIGWILGYINEKQSGGSIISSWLLHGVANFLSSAVAMFEIL